MNNSITIHNSQGAPIVTVQFTEAVQATTTCTADVPLAASHILDPSLSVYVGVAMVWAAVMAMLMMKK